MKKLIWAISLLLLLVPFTSEGAVTNSSSYGTVKTYIFYKSDCDECDESIAWIKDYINKHTYVTSEYVDIDKNSELFDKVKNQLKIKKDDLPLIVIGTNYFNGFDEKVETKVIEVLEAYHDQDYCDVISKINDNADIKDCLKQNRKFYKQSNSSAIIIWIVVSCVLVVGAITVWILIKRKKN